MLQRRSTPLLVVRALVFVVAYSAVVLTPGHASQCQEVPREDGCADRWGPMNGSSPPYVGDLFKYSRGLCPPLPECEGQERVELRHTFHLAGNDLGVAVHWTARRSVSQYYLQHQHCGADLCLSYSVINNDINSESLTVKLRQMHYATSGETPCEITLVQADGSECIAGRTVVSLPVSCYDGFRNCSQCPPAQSSELEVISGVTMATESSGVVSREVRWRWKKGRSYDNETYHVRVREVGEVGEGGERWLEVTGKMSVVIGGLLSSSTYTVSVWRYECSCDLNDPMGQHTLHPVSDLPPHSKLLTPSPHSTPSPDSPRSPNYTPSTLSPCPSASLSHHHPPITTHPPTPPLISSSHNDNAVIGITTVLVVAIVAIATLIGIILGVRRLHLQQKRREEEGEGERGGKEEEWREEEGGGGDRDETKGGDSQCDSPSSSRQPEDGAVLASWSLQPLESGRGRGERGRTEMTPGREEDKLPVMVLYSKQTSEEEVQCIHDDLVGGLCNYNIEAWTPGTAPPRLLDLQWVEQGLRAGQAVLLVCNREFHWEWQLQCEGGQFHIASAVKSMLGGLGQDDLRKIRCVYLREADKPYSTPSLLLQQPFCLSDDQALDNIARFIRNSPRHTNK